jgi:hypothetical protein
MQSGFERGFSIAIEALRLEVVKASCFRGCTVYIQKAMMRCYRVEMPTQDLTSWRFVGVIMLDVTVDQGYVACVLVIVITVV